MVQEKSGDKVTVLKCENYDRLEVYKTVKKSIDLLGGINSFISKGDKVLLKPNMFRTSKKGTTHPSVVYAIAKIFKEGGAKLYLTDSPMIHSLKNVADFNGITEVCNELDIKMLPIRVVKNTIVNNPKLCKNFFLPEFINDMDLIVNIPKIKSHPLTVFSGSVKNLFGFCTGTTKSQFHLRFKKKYDFCHMLLDLYSIIRPGLTIMDAIDGVDSTGQKKRVGLLLASKDSIALDVIACKTVGIPYDLVLTNVFGEERNLGVMAKEKIQILGDSFNFPVIDNFEYEINHYEAISSMTISLFDAFFLKNSIGKPYVTDTCKRCEECIKICPKNAIRLTNVKAKIDYSKCIRCYCCQEICPNKAIVIKTPNPLFLLLTSFLQAMVVKLRSFESKKIKKFNNEF